MASGSEHPAIVRKTKGVSGIPDTPESGSARVAYDALAALLCCRALLAWGLSRSQPEPGMEFLNSDCSPQCRQVPTLVGPLGLSIIQKCSQSDLIVSSMVKSGPFLD